jgi:3-hydroxyisobutyrate dehydrogenase-like beta-hydroxyacid dehydrogenase
MAVINVTDYSATDRLLRSDGVAEALRGKLLVQLTSGSPRQARDMAEWADRHGIGYLDGAIMATPNLIGGPECTILYAGRRPLLSALGGNTVHVGGDVGRASALDSALLVVMWGTLFGALQGTAICQAEGIELQAYLDYLEPILPQISDWARDVVLRSAEGRLAADEATLSSVDVHGVGLRALIELCRDRGIHRGLPEAFDQILQAAIRAGHAQDDFAVLGKFLR